MTLSVARRADDVSPAPRSARLAQRLARRLVLAKLAGLEVGCLRLEEDGREFVLGRRGASPQARIRVHDPAFFAKVAVGGGVGAAESYMAGHWSADDLTTLVRLMVRNRELLENMERGWARLSRPLKRLFHRLNANTRRGSRRNIEAHYDLGNDFYELFLDPTMMYSCAVFERQDMSLEEASRAKLERLCRKLDLRPDDHVLEIGTGWGGFALHAASRYGCRVTTTTISPAQHRYARERVQAARLDDRVEVLDRDYRDLTGRYDKLVSIEMIEAVGHERLDEFFCVCSERLADDGVMALQAITIADRFYERARRSVDFIQRYIFPGGAVPSVGAMAAAVARATDLTVVHLEDIGAHYAETLRAWRERFFAQLDEVRRQGFSERFIRMWEYYFCYCEGGFRERSIGDVQLILAKPLARRPPILGVLEG